MKVFIHYNPSSVPEGLHKTLKIGLPKKWLAKPPAPILATFVENYNTGKEGTEEALNAAELW